MVESGNDVFFVVMENGTGRRSDRTGAGPHLLEIYVKSVQRVYL